MPLQPGRYLIRLKEDESLYLGIGPVPRIYPLRVLVKVFNEDRRSVWIFKRAEDEFVTVSSEENFGLEWIKDDENQLLASTEDIKPGKFVFENAWIDGTWTIKAKDSDLLLTKIESDGTAPELVFKPVDGTKFQLFIVERLEPESEPES